MRYWFILTLFMAVSPIGGAERYFLDDVVNVQIVGAVRQDRLSTNLSSAGDFNNDGLDDITISTNQFDEEGRPNHIYIIPGATDLPNLIDLNESIDGIFTLKSDLGTMRTTGVGDFNGDGFDDIAVGLPGRDLNQLSRPGETLILFGHVFSSTEVDFLDPLNGIRIQGSRSQELIGIILEAGGDINGDGYSDVLIRGWKDLNQSLQEVLIVYGGPTLPNILSTGDIGNHGTFINSAFTLDQFGDTLACAGDVNGDGFDDILIGADANDQLSDRAYLIYGGTDLPPVIEASDLGDLGVVIDGESYMSFTQDVSSLGDVNRDGYDDILVSKPGTSPGGIELAGEVYIIFGAPDLPNNIRVANLGNHGITIQGTQSNEILAQRFNGPANWNGDNYPDFAMTPDFDRHDLYLIMGGDWYETPKTIHVDQIIQAIIHDPDPIRPTFPMDLTILGDINGDGLDDLGVADWFCTYEGRSSAGAVYVFYGGQFFPTPTMTMTPTKIPSPTKTPIPKPSNTPTPTLPHTEQYQGWILYGDGEVKKVQN